MTSQERNFFRREPLRLLSLLPAVLLTLLIYTVLCSWIEANTVCKRFQESHVIELGEIDSTGNWKN